MTTTAPCPHTNSWFSREFCWCGSMHYFCKNNDCAQQIDPCREEAPVTEPTAAETAERNAKLAKKYLDMQDVIEEVHYRFRMFTTPTTGLVNQAHHLIELDNAVSDLASWHESCDDHGTLSWEREDADQ